MSHLEFLIWNRWLDDQWNVPSRADWYAAQIAAEIRLVRNSFSKKPTGVRLNQFKIKFQNRAEEDRPLTPEQASAYEKTFLAKLGMTGDAYERAIERGKRAGNVVNMQPEEPPQGQTTGVNPAPRAPGVARGKQTGAKGLAPNAPNIKTPRGSKVSKRQSKPPRPTIPPHVQQALERANHEHECEERGELGVEE